MGKLACVCGNVISDSNYPSASNHVLFSERALGEFLSIAGGMQSELGKLTPSSRSEWIRNRFGILYPADASNGEILEDVLSQSIRSLSTALIKCDVCGRLHLQKSPAVNEYDIYIAEK